MNSLERIILPFRRITKMTPFTLWNLSCSLIGVSAILLLGNEDPIISALRAAATGIAVGNVIGRTVFDIWKEYCT